MSREFEQDSEVGGAFQIQHPTLLFRLKIVFKANLLERLDDLTTAIIDPMRLANEGYKNIPISGLVKNYLGVACRDDLTGGLFRRLAQELVDLSLAENLQMCVRFVQQQH